MGAERGTDPTLTPEAVVRDHGPAILAVCLANTHSLHDAEDAVQDTLVKAMACVHQLREPERIRPWILQIARRICIDRHRRRPAACCPLPEHISAPDRPVDPRLERLHAALARLPEGYREPISLFYLASRSTAEVAEVLGISEGAVRQRLCRARVMLYDLLAGEEP